MLQGHLLRYKNDPRGAIEGVRLLAEEKKANSGMGLRNMAATGNKTEAPAKPAVASKRRVLTAEEIDKMYFNPQTGWDKDVPSI